MSLNTITITGKPTPTVHVVIDAEGQATNVSALGKKDLNVIISVVGELTAGRSEKLRLICHNFLRVFPITEIRDGLGLTFDLEQWKRDNKKGL